MGKTGVLVVSESLPWRELSLVLGGSLFVTWSDPGFQGEHLAVMAVTLVMVGLLAVLAVVRVNALRAFLGQSPLLAATVTLGVILVAMFAYRGDIVPIALFLGGAALHNLELARERPKM